MTEVMANRKKKRQDNKSKMSQNQGDIPQRKTSGEEIRGGQINPLIIQILQGQYFNHLVNAFYYHIVDIFGYTYTSWHSAFDDRNVCPCG